MTGPVTFGMQVVDADKRPIYYDSQIADVLPKMIALKARWCEAEMVAKTGVKETLVVLNEPYLASLGSSVVPLDRETVRTGWDDIQSIVQGGLGIHCCSNTDWGFILGLRPSVISLDAYTTAKEFLLYTEEIISYLEDGGVVAWGIRTGTVQTIRGREHRFALPEISGHPVPASARGSQRNCSMHSPLSLRAAASGLLTAAALLRSCRRRLKYPGGSVKRRLMGESPPGGNKPCPNTLSQSSCPVKVGREKRPSVRSWYDRSSRWARSLSLPLMLIPMQIFTKSGIAVHESLGSMREEAFSRQIPPWDERTIMSGSGSGRPSSKRRGLTS